MFVDNLRSLESDHQRLSDLKSSIDKREAELASQLQLLAEEQRRGRTRLAEQERDLRNKEEKFEQVSVLG